MASTCASNLIAVCQMTSTSDKEKNINAAEQLIKVTAALGAKVVAKIFFYY